MPRIVWDVDNERSYEYGISHGVLYLKKDILNDGTSTDYMPGVVWNGLTSVDIEPDGFDRTTLGNDGFIYDNLYTPEYLSGTIESYGYPQVFAACIGRNNPTNGVYVGQQKHKKFGMCYRTEVSGGYIIHVIYNCTAHPSEEASETIGDSIDAMMYSWKFDTIPVEHDDFIPFSEITFDTRQLPADKLQLLEDMLYGSSENYPTLLNPDALLRLVDSGDVPSPWPSGDADAFIKRTIESYTGNTTETVGEYAFRNCYSLTSVNFPACTTISGYAFAYCSSLTSVSFPACTTIKYNAFESCFSLTSVSFPACTIIGSHAFGFCRLLTSISFPACTTIGESAFSYCIWLTSVSFPACTTIGESAFVYCQALTSVSFPACTTISYSAFESCFSLTSVSFPACTIIGSRAFGFCSSLTSISFPACTTIEAAAFSYCTKLNRISFPACTAISTYAFEYCHSLTSVSFPACTTISGYAFFYCSSLTSISFPACTIIGSRAFEYCHSLTSVSFPACTIIEGRAFYSCYNLISLYLLGSLRCSLVDSRAFYSTPISNYSASAGRYGSIFVPASLVDAYKSAPNWSYYSDRITAYIEE